VPIPAEVHQKRRNYIWNEIEECLRELRSPYLSGVVLKGEGVVRHSPLMLDCCIEGLPE